MGLKNEVEKFASEKGINLREYQKGNIRNIERSFDEKKIDADKAVEMIAYEFKKEGKLLSSLEKSELRGKLK